jgi:hypothetical protein
MESILKSSGPEAYHPPIYSVFSDRSVSRSAFFYFLTCLIMNPQKDAEVVAIRISIADTRVDYRYI